MAKTSDYSRARYVAMQATLWLILGASVGVAALVSYVRKGVMDRIDLGPSLQLQTVSIRLPKDWRVRERSDGWEAIERVRSPWRRQIAVSERDPREDSFLERLFGSAPARGQTPDVPMGPTTGALSMEEVELDEESGVSRVQLTLSGALSNGHIVSVVLIALDRAGQMEAENVALIKQVAQSLGKREEAPIPQMRAPD